MQLFARYLAFAAPFFAHAAPSVSPAANARVEGKWIVQLKPGTNAAAIAAHHNKVRSLRVRNLGRRSDDGVLGGIEHEFQFGDFTAYAGSFDSVTIEQLKELDEVSRSMTKAYL